MSAGAGLLKKKKKNFKEMMSATVTESYPAGPAKLGEGSRGVHVLQLDANGMEKCVACVFFFSSRRRHTRLQGDWSSDVCSSDLECSLPEESILSHRSPSAQVL